MTVLIYLLAERDQVRLDEPVATYWPEFAQHGKSSITIRQVLQHRSGLVQSMSIGDALAMSNWDAFTHRVAHSRPALMPGDGPAYQALSYGFILGKIVQRVTQRPIREVLASELLNPLAMHDTFLGLPDELWERHVPVLIRLIALGALWSLQRRHGKSLPTLRSSMVSVAAAVLACLLIAVGGSVAVRHLSPPTPATTSPISK